MLRRGAALPGTRFGENTAHDPRAYGEPLRRLGVTPRGTIRYWAAAREAAGCAEEPFEARTLAAALDAALGGRGSRFADVVRRCSFLVDGDPVGRRDHAGVALSDGAVIEVLPPFAGG